ncbi:MAG TPA: DUF4249 family protein [Bacteroidia bacterium]|jgi:hypothetical protein|nr:DUF4249 family protein [Bacteroidia bacterium]
MKKTILNIFVICSLMMFIASCTTVIQVTVPTAGSTFVVVDAFINNKPQAQIVRLTTTANYFSNAPTPPVLGATVTLNDLTNNLTYTFKPDGNGNYIYTPLINDSMAAINHKYQLNISYNGNNYFALSTLNKTTVVDSIIFRSTQRDLAGNYPNDTTNPRRFFPLVLAKDIKGEANYYWLRVYKNGVFYNGPNQLKNFQDDGDGSDGYLFNPQFSFFQLTPDDNPINRYDVCTIEILSIDKNTNDFLGQLQTQLTNSQNGLFAVTPENVKTNIQQTSGTQKAIGWFNMGASSSKSRIAL